MGYYLGGEYFETDAVRDLAIRVAESLKAKEAEMRKAKKREAA